MQMLKKKQVKIEIYTQILHNFINIYEMESNTKWQRGNQSRLRKNQLYNIGQNTKMRVD